MFLAFALLHDLKFYLFKSQQLRVATPSSLVTENRDHGYTLADDIAANLLGTWRRGLCLVRVRDQKSDYCYKVPRLALQLAGRQILRNIHGARLT